jgi:hypothetical protein
MLKKLTVLTGLVLALALTSPPAFALGLPGFKHHETGNVTAVDKSGRTFTVKADKDQKPYIFQVKDRGLLNTLRVGEHVRVAYSKHGAQLIADSVSEKAGKTTAARR